MSKDNTNVMVAMSGGVDSSVAAFLLKNMGYNVAGMMMRLFDPCQLSDRTAECPESDDVKDARSVAQHLGIPFYCPDMSSDFTSTVIDNFADTYLKGETPNPCIVCNKHIKFGVFRDEALSLGYDKIATGHYARIEKNSDGRYLLRKAADLSKDQSYVLYSLSQEQLASTVLPLGELTKEESRKIAEEAGLPVFSKGDSQDICFVKDGDYCAFLKGWCRRDFPSGDFVDTNGNYVAEHKGIVNYTVGQRKGLGISSEAPWYVLDKIPEENRVVLCRGEELFVNTLVARNVNFIPFDKLDSIVNVHARIRYAHREAPAKISPWDDGRVLVEFETPQRAPAAGQSVVFYDGEYVIGGGIIDKKQSYDK